MLKLTRYPIRRKHLWKGSCVGLSMVHLISLLVFGYLKVIGEILPFCYYDNVFFGIFYFIMFLYGFVGVELANVPMSKSHHRLWYTNKFVASCVLLVELEGLCQFALTYGRVSYELEVDYVASAYVYGLLVLGIVRFAITLLLVSIGCGKLNQTIRTKSYHPEQFGLLVSFFSDFTIMQLYCYTAYIYDFALPLMIFISAVAYVYYKHLRV